MLADLSHQPFDPVVAPELGTPVYEEREAEHAVSVGLGVTSLELWCVTAR